MSNQRHEKPNREPNDHRGRLVGAIAVMALGIGALGAYSFASQMSESPGSLPLTPSAVIRTTPDAPREVPPPVEATR